MTLLPHGMPDCGRLTENGLCTWTTMNGSRIRRRLSAFSKPGNIVTIIVHRMWSEITEIIQERNMRRVIPYGWQKGNRNCALREKFMSICIRPKDLKNFLMIMYIITAMFFKVKKSRKSMHFVTLHH